MSTPLTLHTGHHPDGRPLLAAHGEIDMTNVAAFNTALAAAVAEGIPVVVDLTGVEYLDSGAITALFAHAEHLHLIPNPLLLPTLTTSGMTTLATVEHPDTHP